MIPLRSRLPSEEFKARGYKTATTPFFLLKSKKNGVGYPRIGIVIGKSVYKEAAKRNFWERQAKAGLLKKISGSNDILLMFIPSKIQITKKQFHENLEAAVYKSKL